MKEMTFEDETGEYSSVGNYYSVDSKKFNNKLNIDNSPAEYAEIGETGNVTFIKRIDEKTMPEYAEIDKSQKANPPYATIDLNKKREERLKKQQLEMNDLNKVAIYEDIRNTDKIAILEESNIYELVSSEEENTVEYSEVQDKYDVSFYAEPHIC